jgi:hypothetical protein
MTIDNVELVEKKKKEKQPNKVNAEQQDWKSPKSRHRKTKKQKEENRPALTRACWNFAKSGICDFGDSCRFSHDQNNDRVDTRVAVPEIIPDQAEKNDDALKNQLDDDLVAYATVRDAKLAETEVSNNVPNSSLVSSQDVDRDRRSRSRSRSVSPQDEDSKRRSRSRSRSVSRFLTGDDIGNSANGRSRSLSPAQQ